MVLLRAAPQASDAESITAELQRVDTELIINFGFLFLDKSKSGLLGSGGSARVYKATLKGEQVAAKVLYVIVSESPSTRYDCSWSAFQPRATYGTRTGVHHTFLNCGCCV